MPQFTRQRPSLNNEACIHSSRFSSILTLFAETTILKRFLCRSSNTIQLETIRRLAKGIPTWGSSSLPMAHPCQLMVAKE